MKNTSVCELSVLSATKGGVDTFIIVTPRIKEINLYIIFLNIVVMALQQIVHDRESRKFSLYEQNFN